MPFGYPNAISVLIGLLVDLKIAYQMPSTLSAMCFPCAGIKPDVCNDLIRPSIQQIWHCYLTHKNNNRTNSNVGYVTFVIRIMCGN